MMKGRFQFGEFDGNVSTVATPFANITVDAVFSKEHQQLSREAAEQSIVLLQNSVDEASPAHLPLKRGLKIAVIGPNGDSADVYLGE